MQNYFMLTSIFVIFFLQYKQNKKFKEISKRLKEIENKTKRLK